MSDTFVSVYDESKAKGQGPKLLVATQKQARLRAWQLVLVA